MTKKRTFILLVQMRFNTYKLKTKKTSKITHSNGAFCYTVRSEMKATKKCKIPFFSFEQNIEREF